MMSDADRIEITALRTRLAKVEALLKISMEDEQFEALCLEENDLFDQLAILDPS